VAVFRNNVAATAVNLNASGRKILGLRLDFGWARR
jgi:hypothetical protein